MKEMICAIWILLVGLQINYQGIVYSYYLLQQGQITQKYCKNKAKPALRCNGKCHLKTMLEANRTPDSKQSSIPPKEIHVRPLIGLLQPLPNFCTSVFTSFFSFSSSEIIASVPHNYTCTVTFKLLDPPKQITASILC